MSTSGLRSLPFAVACAAAFATLRCNAVLGIEEAQYDPTFVAETGGSSTGGSAGTTSTPNYSGTHLPIGCIEPLDGCANCLRDSGFDEQACFEDPACRKALDDYRVCLGDTCTGGDRCLEEVLFPVSQKLVESLVGGCSTACGQKPLYTQCELYCACMDHNCAGSLGAIGADCLTRCKQDAADPGIAYCRKSHCEFAGLKDPVMHCEHALGLNACQTAPVADPSCDRVQIGFPCSARSDCCSDNCSNQVCR